MSVNRNPAAYEGLKKQLQAILREEKAHLDQAIEDILDLGFELEEEEDEKGRDCNVRELRWLDKDLQGAEQNVCEQSINILLPVLTLSCRRQFMLYKESEPRLIHPAELTLVP